MSAKASIKTLVPESGAESQLFRWISLLTGSKNALKGIGYFLGGLLLQLVGFRGALIVLAGMLLLVLLATLVLLPRGLGKMKIKPRFTEVFSRSPALNWLSAARFFLFGARDVWFVVGLPVFLYSVLGWSFSQVGGFLALWIIGYGLVQACAPRLLRRSHGGAGPDGGTAQFWAFLLAFLPAAIAIGLMQDRAVEAVLIIGLIAFGALFAINSAVHSYLVVAWSDRERVSMNVGFYYMANAGGRLLGTVLSGWVYQTQGLVGCLWVSSAFVLLSALPAMKLPRNGMRRTDV
jgi:predicted MFS family arabinose efflux permease